MLSSHLGVAHTLKLPQHQRMSLGRPSLPPIPSESGNGTEVAEYHAQQLASYGYGGVEPPRYDQVTCGSDQEPQSSHSGRTSANPPTYNMDEAHGSGPHSAPSSEAVGDYFRESQQFASSVEIHTAAMEGVKSSTMKKLVGVGTLSPCTSIGVDPLHDRCVFGLFPSPNPFACPSLLQVFQYGVEYRDQGGRTPLMYAVLGNQPKMCEVCKMDIVPRPTLSLHSGQGCGVHHACIHCLPVGPSPAGCQCECDRCSWADPPPLGCIQGKGTSHESAPSVSECVVACGCAACLSGRCLRRCGLVGGVDRVWSCRWGLVGGVNRVWSCGWG